MKLINDVWITHAKIHVGLDRRKTQKSSQIKRKLECESLNTNIQIKALQWRVRAEPACLPEALFRSWVSQSPRLSKSHRSYSDLELSLAEVNQKCCLTVTVCLVEIKAKPKARSCLHLFISSLFLTFLFRKPSWEGKPDITRQVARSLNMWWDKRWEITSKNPSYISDLS